MTEPGLAAEMLTQLTDGSGAGMLCGMTTEFSSSGQTAWGHRLQQLPGDHRETLLW